MGWDSKPPTQEDLQSFANKSVPAAGNGSSWDSKPPSKEELNSFWGKSPDAMGPEQEEPGYLKQAGSALMGAIGYIGEKEQQYGGGTATRAAINDLLEGKSATEAGKQLYNSYGKGTEEVPTGKELAVKAGVPSTPLSEYVPALFGDRKGGWTGKGGVLDISPAGVAGLGTEIATDPVNVLAGPVSKGVGALGKFIGAGENKALNILADVPERVAELYKKNPAAVENALPKEEIANKIADALGNIREDSTPLYSKAMSVLSDERSAKRGFELNKTAQLLDSLEHPQAAKLKDQLLQAHADRTMSGLVPDINSQYLTESELHTVKKTLQDLGDWQSTLPKPSKAIVNQAAGEINATLKSANPEYSKSMEDIASQIQLKKQLASKFGIIKDVNSESGFAPSDKTLTAIDDVARGKKMDRQNILKSLDEAGYGDLKNDIQLSAAKSALEGGVTNGSRKAVMGYAAGKLLAEKFGGKLVPGEIGGAIGSQFGGSLDKYGRAMGRGVLQVTQPAVKAIENVTPTQIKAFNTQNAIQRRLGRDK